MGLRCRTLRGRRGAVTPSCYAYFRAVGYPRSGCLIAAAVLGCCFGNPESLLSGATPDPSEPARDPDAASRLQLGQALQRAKYAIAWELTWPHLARLLSLAGLFLVVSWAGLWLALPFCRARRRDRPVRARGARGAVSAGEIPLAEPRSGPQPARPRHRHPPSPGDRAVRYAGHARIRSRRRCGRHSASARWHRSSASAPACRRRGWRSMIPGRCARWSR